MREVQDALHDIGIPVSVGIWKSGVDQLIPPPQYIQYSTSTTEYAHSDDRPTAYRTYVYMSLWSQIDPTEIAAIVRERMYDAGFAMIEQTDKGYRVSAYDEMTDQFAVQWTWVLFTERKEYGEYPAAGI